MVCSLHTSLYFLKYNKSLRKLNFYLLCSLVRFPTIITAVHLGSCDKGVLQVSCHHHYIWNDFDWLPWAAKHSVALCGNWWSSQTKEQKLQALGRTQDDGPGQWVFFLVFLYLKLSWSVPSSKYLILFSCLPVNQLTLLREFYENSLKDFLDSHMDTSLNWECWSAEYFSDSLLKSWKQIFPSKRESREIFAFDS